MSNSQFLEFHETSRVDEQVGNGNEANLKLIKWLLSCLNHKACQWNISIILDKLQLLTWLNKQFFCRPVTYSMSLLCNIFPYIHQHFTFPFQPQTTPRWSSYRFSIKMGLWVAQLINKTLKYLIIFTTHDLLSLS